MQTGSLRVVMRSLKVTRGTLALAACIPAIVAMNGMVLASLPGPTGLPVGVGVAFVLTVIATFLVVSDVLDRSRQVVTAMRSIGANKRSLGSPILLGLLGFGAAGALLGSGLGAAAAGAVSLSVPGAAIATDALLVTVATVIGTGSGAYIGMMVAWKS
jgi:FtsX-like permease family